MTSSLNRFSDPTRTWFMGAFHAPTLAQEAAWEAIASDRHALVVAPTGSGKTLAAFLWALDSITLASVPEEDLDRCRILYVSPLKALGADVERNLRTPLVGIEQSARRTGLVLPEIRVGMRAGDTPAKERRAFGIHPPDILITTPESLFLILNSKARSGLAGVSTVIVDEIHALAGTKRGAHLALSLERLDHMLPAPAQRIGLSATVRPVDRVAAFLTGARTTAEGGREVTIVQPKSEKEIKVDVVVPVIDLADLTLGAVNNDALSPDAGLESDEPDLSGAADKPLRQSSIWPHVEERIVDAVTQPDGTARTTLVFTNSRRVAERMASRLNEIWNHRHGIPQPDPGEYWPSEITAQSGVATATSNEFARAHHGSMSKEERVVIEEALKAGELPVVVATSSLELGIDMGSIDLVIQVGAPPSVASALQRIGRAGHQVGAISHGVIFPTHRGDLIQSAVVSERMLTGAIEQVDPISNPLDVLAQQIVSMASERDWQLEELLQIIRRSAPFRSLGVATATSVFDMLAGRYPSEDFAELRPRIVWDRITDTITARPGAAMLAATSGGTIPDRGLYGVFINSSGAPSGDDNATAVAGRRGGRRVGELDEEMVYESRVGDVFTLGSSSWKIQEITPDRVLVSPAPGRPGRLPFWKGDSPGRPFELGKATGEFLREIGQASETGAIRLAAAGLDDSANLNLLAYLAEQRSAATVVPDDKTILVERFQDELGDWRLVIHTPFGARVHAPWSLVIGTRAKEQFGIDAQVMHSDDGIVLRLPETSEALDDLGQGGKASPAMGAELFFDADETTDLVTAALGSSAVFAARFREAAARSLLLPRRQPQRRQPLWQQRQRSSQLLEIAANYDSFPVVHEALRECLQDVFDVPALKSIMAAVQNRTIRVVEVTTDRPSPFAQSLLFNYTAQFLYDGDTPLAERRASALTLDPSLLAKLLGSSGPSTIADLLVPEAVAQIESELARTAPHRQARTAEHLVDVLRALGPLSRGQLILRWQLASDQLDDELENLVAARRIIAVRVAGAECWAAIEDSGRLRDALGVALPVGIPEAFTEPTADPLGDLARRHSRTNGPFTSIDIARRFGIGTAVAGEILRRLEITGTLVSGHLRPVPREVEAVADRNPSLIESASTTAILGNDLDQFLEYCDVDVMRRLRRASLAALRSEVEPVPAQALAHFLPGWQGISARGGQHRGVDGLLRAIEQLSGLKQPASAWESLIFPSRVRDYQPGFLDELTASGEVLWSGQGTLAKRDGWVSWHLAETAPFSLDQPVEIPIAEVHQAILDTLSSGGGFFAHNIAEAIAVSNTAPFSSAELIQALWDLVWTGHLTNDTFTPLRMMLSGRGSHRAAPPKPRARPARAYSSWALSHETQASAMAGSTPALPRRPGRGQRTGAGVDLAYRTIPGRWSLLPIPETDPTIRNHALVGRLLDRHGIVTRPIAVSEDIEGGFSSVYRVLSAMEEAGRIRRGYFLESLGGSQFAIPGAVDRLRAEAELPDGAHATVLAATDPANPFGGALAWPPSITPPDSSPPSLSARATTKRGNHRPGRKPGALVVIVGHDLIAYLERGARTMLTFTPDPTALEKAAQGIAALLGDARLTTISIDKIDSAPALGHPGEMAMALRAAGFTPTPRGLRLRGAHR